MTNDQSHFFKGPVQLVFATKFTYKGTCQLHYNSFCSGHFVSMRFTRYSKALILDDVTNLVIETVLIQL